ncbi:16174_t:CDS:2 [Funneliformis caledonium]|uniref:Histone-lysine N-methyltransferase, H3 lysine-4 specific n=1 Tax=Funneliformis caledonium TaxID=1117310 RepID=A0A9N8VK22_9GLOM|nr:16174_t:CDS:2 [Funneliformis caledonium]
MEHSNPESRFDIETFPEYFPILEVDNKSRLLLRHYKPRIRSFSAPAASHVQQGVQEDDRKDDQDFIILHDPKLTPETLQRRISLTRNGDQLRRYSMSDPRGPLRGYGRRVNGKRQRYLKILHILKYESDNNANQPKEASIFISQLDKFVTESQLRVQFEECGNVIYCKIENNPIHNDSLGLARLTFYGENNGDALISARDSIFKFNGKSLFNGPPIKLELDNDGSKIKTAAEMIITESQNSLEPSVSNKFSEPSPTPLPNDDDMEIGDAPSPPAVIVSVLVTKVQSTLQTSVLLDKTKRKTTPSTSNKVHSKDSRVSPEKIEQKFELPPKRPIDDDKEEGEIDSTYEEESYGPASGHLSSREKGKWFEKYSLDSQHLDYSIPTVVPSKRSYDQYIPDYSNDRSRHLNQERRRRNSSRERFIRNNLNVEKSRSRSRGRSPIGSGSQPRSRDRDFGRSRNHEPVRNRDRDSIQSYKRDSSRSHDRDMCRTHDRSNARDNVYRSHDHDMVRSGRDMYKEAHGGDKKAEEKKISETRDFWADVDKKLDGPKSSSEFSSRDHTKFRKRSQLNKDNSSKSHSVNESRNNIQNENKDSVNSNSMSTKRLEFSHISKFDEDRSAFGLNLKKSAQRVSTSKVESIDKYTNVNRLTKLKSYPSKPQPSSRPSEGYRKPNISDWDYSYSSSSDSSETSAQKKKKAQDAKGKLLPKNISLASNKVEDNKKVDNDEKKQGQNHVSQRKKSPQKQVKSSIRSASESRTKSKVVRKSKYADLTSDNIIKEADNSISESSAKAKTVRKQKSINTSNIRTNLEAQNQSRKLKETVIHRSSNDLASSENSDSDNQTLYKSHLYNTSNESTNDDDDYTDRDYLTSGDDITDAYDLDMIRLYFELNEKGLLNNDGEPIEWSENEEFTIRVGDHVESFKDYAPDDGPHKTGCARTEGYYKIPPEEKRKYVAYGIPGTSYATDKAPAPSSRASRAKRRELQSRMAEYQDVATDADILLYNPLKAREKELTIAKSKIHHYGLFALERIKSSEFVIQYTGELIRQAVADLRERKYKAEGIDGSYMFRVGDDTIIDATKMGNNARLINHSCDPNCNAKILTIKGKKKIAIYAKRDIEFGEEITYDYKFPIDKHDKIPCHCGASNCRGFLN